ncbi:peptidoglycan DD-metalloendopeptidase family protein [Nocardia sp. ET3-3]|uniref:Peptidoglycan DD-metalloendopeptidase family protein n=1 Tax=Nocardia terrae TaxID=2675851 RepID=A0A7K1V2S9_9NOCA|nr:peptidoglycan DD-metalloendopeptidase family protein [Nocardia terrae]MVU80841.1 peptidoglycan DD-metalloendopeptidase family protein [Nocardia terrae]
MGGALPVLLVPVAALAIVGAALLFGSGDRTPVQHGCLPDIPRSQPHISVQSASLRVETPLPEGTFTVSSGFGPRDGGVHLGVDLAAAQGTPILAATDGTVVAAGPASGFGNWIIIDTLIDGGLLSTVYGHMFDDGVNVTVGEQVQAGQPIGAVGSNGEATGPHLHFEVVPGGRQQGGHQIDPVPWLAAHGAPVDGDSTTAQPAGSTPLNGDSVRPRSSRSTAFAARMAGLALGCEPPSAVGRDELRSGSVPAEYEPWIRKAARTCPDVTGPLLAAQLRQESGFRADAVSPDAGAQGPAQFMPATWAAYGIDGDGDGRIDVWSIPDAVMSQARYDCDLVRSAKTGLAQGSLRGDLTELWLSMYNCGPEGTLAAGGVCQNSQTLHYVKAIPALAATYVLANGGAS